MKRTTRLTTAILAGALLLVPILTASCSSVDCQAIDAVYTNLKDIRQRYDRYVRADTSLHSDPRRRESRQKALLLQMESTYRLVAKLKENCQ